MDRTSQFAARQNRVVAALAIAASDGRHEMSCAAVLLMITPPLKRSLGQVANVAPGIMTDGAARATPSTQRRIILLSLPQECAWPFLAKGQEGKCRQQAAL